MPKWDSIWNKKLFSELEKLVKKEQGVFFEQTNITEFANTDALVTLLHTIRDNHVCIVADCDNRSNGNSTAENFDELLQTIHTVKMSSPNRITVVIPFQPYARQDKPKARQSATAAIKLREIETAGTPWLREIFAFDPHNPAATGYTVNTPFIPLYASQTVIPYFCKMDIDEVWSGDVGRGPMAKHFAEKMEKGFGIIYKIRDYSRPNESEAVGYLGSPKGKKILLVDDMIDGGGTITNAISLLFNSGAKQVYAFAPHILLNIKQNKKGELVDPDILFQELQKDERFGGLIGTDTVHNGRIDLSQRNYYTELSVAPQLAEIIYSVNTGQPISNLLS